MTFFTSIIFFYGQDIAVLNGKVGKPLYSQPKTIISLTNFSKKFLTSFFGGKVTFFTSIFFFYSQDITVLHGKVGKPL